MALQINRERCEPKESLQVLYSKGVINVLYGENYSNTGKRDESRLHKKGNTMAKQIILLQKCLENQMPAAITFRNFKKKRLNS